MWQQIKHKRRENELEYRWEEIVQKLLLHRDNEMESTENKVKHLKPLGRKPNINLIRFPEGKYRTSYMKDIPSYRFKKPNETRGVS